MFKVGDIVKTKYESGSGSFKVVEILNETHMIVVTTDPNLPLFNIAVKWIDWELDKTQYRKGKITKISEKIKNK